MGLLDGGAAALFTELLSPLYLPATVYAAESTYNERGDLKRSLVERDCLAQVDSATESMRKVPDFAATDRAVYVLSDTLAGGMAEGHEIVVHRGPYAGTRWKVADPIARDPGAAYWLCRAVLGTAVEVVPIKLLRGTAVLSLISVGALSQARGLSGAAVVSIASAGTLGRGAALAGETMLIVSTSAAITRRIDLAATGLAALDTQAALAIGRQFAGSAVVSLDTAGTVAIARALSGTSLVALDTQAALAIGRQFAGSVTVALASAGAISASRQLSGAAPVALATTGAITAGQQFAGTATVALSTTGTVSAAAGLAGTATTALAATATIAVAVSLSGTSAATLSSAGTTSRSVGLSGSVSVSLGTTGTVTAGAAAVMKWNATTAQATTFTNGGRTAAKSGGETAAGIADRGVSPGEKRYWEVVYISTTASDFTANSTNGWLRAGGARTDYPANKPNGYLGGGQNFSILTNRKTAQEGQLGTAGTQLVSGSVVRFAVDNMSATPQWYIAIDGEAWSPVKNLPVRDANGIYYPAYQIEANGSSNAQLIARFAASEQTYSPPAGYSAFE